MFCTEDNQPNTVASIIRHSLNVLQSKLLFRAIISLGFLNSGRSGRSAAPVIENGITVVESGTLHT